MPRGGRKSGAMRRRRAWRRRGRRRRLGGRAPGARGRFVCRRGRHRDERAKQIPRAYAGRGSHCRGVSFGTLRTPPRRASAETVAARAVPRAFGGFGFSLADGAPTSSATRARRLEPRARQHHAPVDPRHERRIDDSFVWRFRMASRPTRERVRIMVWRFYLGNASATAPRASASCGRYARRRACAPRVCPQRQPTRRSASKRSDDVRDDASRASKSATRGGGEGRILATARPRPRACRRRRYLPKTETRATFGAATRSATSARAAVGRHAAGAGDPNPRARPSQGRPETESIRPARRPQRTGRGRPGSRIHPRAFRRTRAWVRRARPRARTRRGGATAKPLDGAGNRHRHRPLSGSARSRVGPRVPVPTPRTSPPHPRTTGRARLPAEDRFVPRPSPGSARKRPRRPRPRGGPRRFNDVAATSGTCCSVRPARARAPPRTPVPRRTAEAPM